MWSAAELCKVADFERPSLFCEGALERIRPSQSRLQTFAVSVGTSEDGAFLDAAEGLEEAPHVVL